MVWCATCKSETEADDVHGAAVCVECGSMLSGGGGNLVSSVEFNEGGTGVLGTSVVGPQKTRVLTGSGRGGLNGPAVDHVWHAFANGKSEIRKLASQLNVSDTIIASATNTYQLGLQLKFTQGRRVDQVAAVCLYIACRINHHPVLLMDLVPLLNTPTPVAVLGRVTLRLTRVLSIKLPAILGSVDTQTHGLDPSVFLYRFASKLELGDETRRVALTGVRVVQRMQRDWIHWGRHPSGIFGAALLIAARLHGFHRTPQEVARVVFVTKGTLSKRVSDFARTPAAALSLEEFNDEGILDGLEECNPPVFEQNRIKEEKEATEAEIIKVPDQLPSSKAELEHWLNEDEPTKIERTSQTTSKSSDKRSNSSPDGHRKHKRRKSNPKILSSREQASQNPGSVSQNLESAPNPGSVSQNLESATRTLLANVEPDSDSDLEALDAEIDGYIVTDEEHKRHQKIWEVVNHDWIADQAEKERQRLEAEAEDAASVSQHAPARTIGGAKKKKKKKDTGPSAAFKLVLDELDLENEMAKGNGIPVEKTADSEEPKKSSKDSLIRVDSLRSSAGSSAHNLSSSSHLSDTELDVSLTEDASTSSSHTQAPKDVSFELSDDDFAEDLSPMKKGHSSLAKHLNIEYAESDEEFFDEF
eukprot:505356_1